MTTATASVLLSLGAREDDSLPKTFALAERRIDSTREAVATLETQQTRLNEELGNTRQGTREYARLERQIESTDREIATTTRRLERQERTWRRVGTAARRASRVARRGALATGAVLAGLTLQVETLGQQYAQFLTVSRQTGIPVEEIGRLRNEVKLTGQELDALQLLELDKLFGEFQGTLRATGQATGSVADGARILNLDLSQVSSTTEYLNTVLDALRNEQNAQVRQFAADRLLAGLSPTLSATLFLSEEELQIARSTTVATEEQTEALVLANAQLNQLKEEFQQVAVAAGDALLPTFTALLDAITPLVQGFGALVSENPHVIAALLGVGLALTTLTAITWLYNAADAVRNALSGPAGWIALGIAVAVGAAFTIAATGAISRANAEREALQRQRDEREENIPRETADATGPAVGKAVRGELDASNRRTEDTLENILPVAECAARDTTAELIEDALAFRPANVPQFTPSRTPEEELVVYTPRETALFSTETLNPFSPQTPIPGLRGLNAQAYAEAALQNSREGELVLPGNFNPQLSGLGESENIINEGDSIEVNIENINTTQAGDEIEREVRDAVLRSNRR